MSWRRSKPLSLVLILGYSFLYLPIITLVVFSLNESRLASVWTGFSTRWYKELFHNTTIIHSAAISFKIATLAATAAMILGTMAAVVLIRLRPVRFHTALNGMVTAPLVMPDIMMGIALLLMFVGLESLTGWPPGRGMFTIVIAHITLGTSYVTVLVRSRLIELDHAIEEAAQDLGAPPWKVFWLITLPMIMPTLAAGWLLAFALSLDDVVLASFLSGPNATTLPMVILSYVRQGISPQINALATLIVAVLSVGVLIAACLIARRSSRS